MIRVKAEQLAAARGCVLGLMLGDAIGATGGNVPVSGTLRATSAGQLACFTVDGLIRTHVRMTHKGVCPPPISVWHAYMRWAAMQGISGIEPWSQEDWPDGWLATVPVLAERRGSAPATVAALKGKTAGTLDKPVGTSIGAHGLTRSLPAGLCAWWPSSENFGAEISALTHTGAAVDAAALGSTLIRLLGEGKPLAEAMERARRDSLGRSVHTGDSLLGPALEAARSKPRQAVELARLAGDAKATSALAGGVYVAMSFAMRYEIRDALAFAASVGDGRHAATVAGALLGAAHGPDALPVDWLSRLELAWVADTLARDLVREVTERPSGSGYGDATDAHWWDRYPGW
ncbi:ADP-ribosylglycohydrolase family protein [Micromonospora sp. NPDC005707]|uniref:ADP-ribosylglycohydrolase family protein n=1 Tax=Micromonospora sp. NPDC005707 TaxID=3157050 RepID=UPI0033ED24E2